MLSPVVKSSKRSGFTLIELLVVIAIIAILAAILFPVFAKAREKARQTSCLSQTKQLGLAFIQYYQDYDEKLPAGSINTVDTTDNAGAGWAGQIYSQVKSVSIYKCPDDSTANGPTFNNVVQVPVSYGFNSNAAGQTQAIYNNVAKSVLLFETVGNTADVTNISSAAKTSGDANSFAGNGIVNGGAGAVDNPATATGSGGVAAYATGYLAGSGATATGTNVGQFATVTGRHSDGSNFLMADGHSKWFRGSAVSAGNSNTINNDCGPSATTFTPTGTAPANSAANSGCSDPKMAATFSVN